MAWQKCSSIKRCYLGDIACAYINLCMVPLLKYIIDGKLQSEFFGYFSRRDYHSLPVLCGHPHYCVGFTRDSACIADNDGQLRMGT